MTFHWSANAAHIQSLYRPWHPDDGYAEAAVQATEARLSVRFPARLRQFYRAWGTRDDLTRTNQVLLPLDQLLLQSDALVICAENQWVWYWAIPLNALDRDDPPVLTAWNGDPLVWQPRHPQLSDFLDYLTYMHAFDGGALHGGYSHEPITDDLWLRMCQYGHVQILPTPPPWLVPDAASQPWSLITGEQYAMHGIGYVGVATENSSQLDDVSQALQITWQHRW
jgi:hypothetical protein